MKESHKEPYGYLVGFGYNGWVSELSRFILFATEQEYIDYILDSKEDGGND